MGLEVPVPEYLTISDPIRPSGIIYYKGPDIEGYPAWYNSEFQRYIKKESIRINPETDEEGNDIDPIFSNEWVMYQTTYSYTDVEEGSELENEEISSSSVIISGSYFSPWNDLTQPSFYDATNYPSITGLQISGAIPSRINGTYVKDDIQKCFEKRVLTWCKTSNQWSSAEQFKIKNSDGTLPYRIDLIGSRSSTNRKYLWRISGAEMPYEFANAFIYNKEVSLGEEPNNIFLPPTGTDPNDITLWTPNPGSGASGVITITYRYRP